MSYSQNIACIEILELLILIRFCRVHQMLMLSARGLPSSRISHSLVVEYLSIMFLLSAEGLPIVLMYWLLRLC